MSEHTMSFRLILASWQTPFNINDELELIGLVDKVNENFELKSEEISADKAYGTSYNRKYLMDKEIAINKRYIVERRLAAMVKKYGLRRSRYLRLKGAKKHILLVNIASNIVRMVNLLINKNYQQLRYCPSRLSC